MWAAWPNHLSRRLRRSSSILCSFHFHRSLLLGTYAYRTRAEKNGFRTSFGMLESFISQPERRVRIIAVILKTLILCLNKIFHDTQVFFYDSSSENALRHANVARLVDAYRYHGYLGTQLDPLGISKPPYAVPISSMFHMCFCV